jgi:hypothetical protein
LAPRVQSRLPTQGIPQFETSECSRGRRRNVEAVRRGFGGKTHRPVDETAARCISSKAS